MYKSLTLVLSGQAGQGLKTIEELLGEAIKQRYHVFSTTKVMSRVRGGNNTVEIRLSDQQVYAYKDHVDVLFLMNNHSYNRLEDRILPTTQVFGEEDFLEDPIKEGFGQRFHPLAINDIAKVAGSVMYGNTVLFGFISGLLALDQAYGTDLIKGKFLGKKDKIIEGNLKAYELAYAEGGQFKGMNTIETTQEVANQKMINGTQAVAIGALAGGINYMASYPMSPGTGVLEYIASKGDDFGVVVEQAEDEIAALNMVIGGWYAGARSMVTTSGGGFALMEEAVSLSGITETPAVIHIAQRPGPGTGLPTRTEQGDLNLAVYSGHGEFPRIVLAPGTLEEGILLTQKAFWLADKYQVPVFILSDQYYLDSKRPLADIQLDENALESYVVPSDEDYLRYRLTDSGISPRAIPGNGQGLVKCDSDEHDEEGTITEDFEVRVKMNDKRLGKDKLILEDYVPAELVGSQNFTKLFIGWGSTYGVMKEAVLSGSSDQVAYLHIKELFPLHEAIKNYADKADQIIVIENNATGQLASLLKLYLDVEVNRKKLKYNGVPFTVEEADAYIKEVEQ